MSRGESTAEPWFETEVRRQRQHQRSDTHQTVSWQWGHRSASDDRDRLYDLLTTVRNFCRLMGVPRQTEIRIASCEELGTACAGFFDAPNSFARPFILIDEGIFDRCVAADCMDVAVGLAIHESMHVLETRKAYRRMTDKDRDERLNSLENLIEDWRIEEICRLDYPGYAPYLYKLRRVLIVDQSLNQALRNWEFLPDVDKIMTIVGAYIRAPDVLMDMPELRFWTDLQDRNIYQFLRYHLSYPPSSEDHVEAMAKMILQLIDNYRDRSLEYLASHDKITPATLDRLRTQEKANAADRAIPGHHNPLGRRRFSISDLLAAQVMDDSVRKGSDDQTLARMKELERGDPSGKSNGITAGTTELPEQRIPTEYRGRIDVVRFPWKPQGRYVYDMAQRSVRADVSRLRHAFRVDEGGKGERGGRSNGKLDRKRIYRAPFDRAIFSETTTEEPGKVLIALLIDASGSMSEGNRFRRAIEVGVLFNEAFINHPHITLHTYSHTSSEFSDHCELSYHGEASKKSSESIGSIEPKISNYDYQAIWGVVAHLSQPSNSYAKRILLSVSDGRPCVPFGVNSSGVEATRKAVDDVRRQGWMVCGIGIGAYHADIVYGDRWTLRVPTLSSLPSNMSSLLIRLLRR